MLLAARGVVKRFGGVTALAGVDLTVAAGEVVALVGENGAGKSTLVGVLGGAHVPDAGTVELGGAVVPPGDPLAARRAGIGIIYQEFTLVPELTVAENVFLGQERSRRGLLDRGRMADEARALLLRLGCHVDPHVRTGAQSVGVQQLVEVARALAQSAKVLVFDEPSATLTDAELAHLFATVRELARDGLGIVYISHRLEEIFVLTERVVVLRDGATVADAAIDALDRRGLIRAMVGRDVDESPPRQARTPGATALELIDVSCPPCFVSATLSVRRGEVVGLAGLVGAGRSSVARCVFGDLAAASGTIAVNGAPVAFRHPARALAAGVGYLTEDRKGAGVYPGLSVRENVTMSTLAQLTRRGLIDARLRNAVADEACARFTVKAAGGDVPIRTLSGGNQQKALLARLMQHELSVVLLDEPTRGVDVGARAEIYRIIEELLQQGVAVLVISSDLPELLRLCDRIVVMHAGRTVGEVAGDASQEEIMALATGELASTGSEPAEGPA